MKKIAVVAYETNAAVCSSMMMHVEMMNDAGFNVTLYLHEAVPVKYFSSYNIIKHQYSSFKELRSWLSENKEDCIWCTNSLYVLLLRVHRIKLPVYIWQQGDGPAESYMRHHNRLRCFVLKKILRYAFKTVSGTIFVSDSMRDYYIQNYRYNKPSAVVPCLSEFSGVEVSVDKIPNSFVYIGGLSVWQCFDEILLLYKRIRKPNSVFHIITLDKETAISKVKSIIGSLDGIEIYSITDRKKIPEILNKFQFGFLVRKDDVVNLVSSPIKFLEYLSCGINVIMTEAVPAYAEIVKKYKIGTVVRLEDDHIVINEFSDNAKDVYNQLFDRGLYVRRYKKLMQSNESCNR